MQLRDQPGCGNIKCSSTDVPGCGVLWLHCSATSVLNTAGLLYSLVIKQTLCCTVLHLVTAVLHRQEQQQQRVSGRGSLVLSSMA